MKKKKNKTNNFMPGRCTIWIHISEFLEISLYLLDVTGEGLAAELRYLGRLQLLSDIF